MFARSSASGDGSAENQASRISASTASEVVRSDSASTLASFHLRAPAAVSASPHSAARMPGTLLAAIDAPVPVQQQTTAWSARPSATSRAAASDAHAQSSRSPSASAPCRTGSWPRSRSCATTAPATPVSSSAATLIRMAADDSRRLAEPALRASALNRSVAVLPSTLRIDARIASFTRLACRSRLRAFLVKTSLTALRPEWTRLVAAATTTGPLAFFLSFSRRAVLRSTSALTLARPASLVRSVSLRPFLSVGRELERGLAAEVERRPGAGLLARLDLAARRLLAGDRHRDARAAGDDLGRVLGLGDRRGASTTPRRPRRRRRSSATRRPGCSAASCAAGRAARRTSRAHRSR